MSDNYCFLSHVLSAQTPSYGNRDRFYTSRNASMLLNDTANTSTWFFSNNHIGTHIDAPRHFNLQGLSVADVPAKYFVFSHVSLIEIHCTEGKLIGIEAIAAESDKIHPDVELLLIRTGYEQYRHTDKYWNDNPGISEDIAPYLRARYPKLRCFGFDFISLTSWNYRVEGRKSHKAFLAPADSSEPIWIIEDMQLSVISSPVLSVIALPLRVDDGDGGPITVIARC
jgi:kynurenine formamidase